MDSGGTALGLVENRSVDNKLQTGSKHVVRDSGNEYVTTEQRVPASSELASAAADIHSRLKHGADETPGAGATIMLSGLGAAAGSEQHHDGAKSLSGLTTLTHGATPADADSAAAPAAYRLYKARFSGAVGIAALSLVVGMCQPWFGPISDDSKSKLHSKHCDNVD